MRALAGLWTLTAAMSYRIADRGRHGDDGLDAWRRRREDELVRLDKFAYGYLFALAMALVRFYFGT